MEPYKLIRSDRRTLSMELSPTGDLILRAPRRLPLREIEEFIKSHEAWIRKHRAHLQKRDAFHEEHFATEEQITALIAHAKAVLPGKTDYWAKIMGVTHTGVCITRAQKRFGSCSPTNHIAYSYRLMAYPEDVIDYVVVHELAHIRHKNHSADFYAFVARFLPDYKRREAILKHR